MGFPHSVAAKSVYFNTLFADNLQKGFFIMKKSINRIFSFPKLNTKGLCLVGLLTAVTVFLSIFATFRIGNAIKIPFKFISVYLTAFLFGPFFAALTAALGDILNAVLFPVGAPLPLLTLLEGIAGFLYGIFFYRKKTAGKGFYLRCTFCTLCQFLLDMFAVTAVLVSAGYFPTFESGFAFRIIAGLVKAALIFAVLISSPSYLKIFKGLSNGFVTAFTPRLNLTKIKQENKESK